MNRALFRGLTLSFCFLPFSAHGDFLPPNKLHLQDDLHRKDANLDEARFNAIIDGVHVQYESVAAALGYRFDWQRLWEDPTVNASTMELEGGVWQMNMYGGLARRPEITADGFAGVICHEIGHHLGGFVFMSDTHWAAGEGQSDYFATQHCLRNLWKHDTTANARFRNGTDAIVKQRCDANWSTVADQNLCYRVAEAGRSLASLLSVLSSEPAVGFETPDPLEVTETNTSYPSAQCRLDTYLAGALCPIDFPTSSILGRNHEDGQNSTTVERLSTSATCHASTGWVLGVRPRCWFKPQLDFLLHKTLEWNRTDLISNGDDVLDPGESFGFHVGMVNETTDRTASSLKTVFWSNTPGVKVSDGEREYQQLLPGQTLVNERPFQVSLSSQMECGSKFDLSFRSSSDQGSTEMKKTFVLGKLGNGAEASSNEALDIPDANETGISSSVDVTSSDPVDAVTVDLDLSHTYMGDLSIVLEAPHGESVTLWNHEGGQGQDLKVSVTRDLRLPRGEGRWTLRVVDGAQADVGRLNGWKLKLQHHTCSGR